METSMTMLMRGNTPDTKMASPKRDQNPHVGLTQFTVHQNHEDLATLSKYETIKANIENEGAVSPKIEENVDKQTKEIMLNASREIKALNMRLNKLFAPGKK